jgi:RNA polymerase sigma factor (sigma-70 family)
VTTQTDSQLLRTYAERKLEPAFTELVHRHVDFVYSAARRMVRDPHLAEDVTQGVFVALAKQAPELADRTTLAGWLHRTAQNIAAQTVRTIERRRAREQESFAMSEHISTSPDVSWEQIEPHLDAALGELNDADRDAVVMRYFHKKSAAEIASILGISDDAAQKRVSRAVERLREFFAKRGVTVGAGGLVVVISANAVQAAPVGLAVTISAAAIAGTAATTSTFIAATTKTIAMTTLQKTLVTATVAVLAGAGIYEAQQAAQLREQIQMLQQQQAPLAEKIQELQRDRDEATNQLAGLLADNARMKANPERNELLKLRGEVTLLRRQAAESVLPKSVRTATTESELTNQSWLERVQLLKQKLKSMPLQQAPENSCLTEDDWLQAAKHNLDSDDDYLAAFADLRARGEGNFLRTMEDALRKYLQANNGVFPTDVTQIKPFFNEPPSDAVLERYSIVPSSIVPQNNLGNEGDWLITLKNPDSGALQTLSANGVAGTSYEDSDAMAVLAPAMKAMFANGPSINGRKNFTIEMIEPYLTTPEQKAAYQKILQRSKINSK